MFEGDRIDVRDLPEYVRTPAAAEADDEFFCTVPLNTYVLLITYLNPVAAALTGWSEEQALGRPAREVFSIVDDETAEPSEDIIARVLHEGCILALANHTALIARDGRQIPIEDSAAPIRDAVGNMAGAVLVFHDVSDKRRERERLLRLNRTPQSAQPERPGAVARCRRKILPRGSLPDYRGGLRARHGVGGIPRIRRADAPSGRLAYSGFEEGYLETLGLTWADTERGRGPTGMAIRTGKVCTCGNMLDRPGIPALARSGCCGAGTLPPSCCPHGGRAGFRGADHLFPGAGSVLGR